MKRKRTREMAEKRDSSTGREEAIVMQAEMTRLKNKFNMSTEDIASALGCSFGSVVNWLKGKPCIRVYQRAIRELLEKKSLAA